MEPLYNEVLGTMTITLLYQVSHYIRVKKGRNIKSWDQQNDLVIRGFCYIQPLYNEVPLYKVFTGLFKLELMLTLLIQIPWRPEQYLLLKLVIFSCTSSYAWKEKRKKAKHTHISCWCFVERVDWLCCHA